MASARRVQLAPSFVLHRRAFSESSLIVEALSAEPGRVGLIAKGARGERSRWRGLLEPFQETVMSWSGRGELQTLTQIDLPGPRTVLTGDALGAGFYVNELVMRLVPRNDPNPDLFLAYRAAIAALVRGGSTEVPLRLFEKRLLDAIGYGLTADRTGDGEPIDPSATYAYVPEQGPMRQNVTEGCRISGAALLALHHERLDTAAHLKEAKQLMRMLIRNHLGERPLVSRALFESRGRYTRAPEAAAEPESRDGHDR